MLDQGSELKWLIISLSDVHLEEFVGVRRLKWYAWVDFDLLNFKNAQNKTSADDESVFLLILF